MSYSMHDPPNVAQGSLPKQHDKLHIVLLYDVLCVRVRASVRAAKDPHQEQSMNPGRTRRCKSAEDMVDIAEHKHERNE